VYVRHQFLHLLPPEAIKDWSSRLPRDIQTISPELIAITSPEGIDFILAIPPALATHLSISNRDHTPPGPDIGRHVIRLVLHLSESQPGGVGYIRTSSELHPPSAYTLSLLGQGILLDGSKCGLGADRNTRIWENLLPQDTLAAEHARLQPSARPVAAALETARLSMWCC
jgi:hypothetical protein